MFPMTSNPSPKIEKEGQEEELLPKANLEDETTDVEPSERPLD